MEQRTATLASISAAEFTRAPRTAARPRSAWRLAGYVLFGADYIQYFTGFWFLSNERPDRLRGERGRRSRHLRAGVRGGAHTCGDHLRADRSYPEYPGVEHPMSILARALADLEIRDAIAADQDGYPGILGYAGPALSDVTEASVVAPKTSSSV